MRASRGSWVASVGRSIKPEELRRNGPAQPDLVVAGVKRYTSLVGPLGLNNEDGRVRVAPAANTLRPFRCRRTVHVLTLHGLEPLTKNGCNILPGCAVIEKLRWLGRCLLDYLLRGVAIHGPNFVALDFKPPFVAVFNDVSKVIWGDSPVESPGVVDFPCQLPHGDKPVFVQLNAEFLRVMAEDVGH